MEAQIMIDADGRITAVYADGLPWEQIAMDLAGETVDIQRASHVEPAGGGRWTADMGPVGGPVLGPFDERSEALAAETLWLRQNHLGIE